MLPLQDASCSTWPDYHIEGGVLSSGWKAYLKASGMRLPFFISLSQGGEVNLVDQFGQFGVPDEHHHVDGQVTCPAFDLHVPVVEDVCLLDVVLLSSSSSAFLAELKDSTASGVSMKLISTKCLKCLLPNSRMAKDLPVCLAPVTSRAVDICLE